MKSKINLPVIHIIGLPGAGKTTLGNKLSKKFGIPLFRIGEFRSRFPESENGEADAWLALFNAMSKHKWKNCIIETTGLNCRESFLNAAFWYPRIITIKLVTQRRVLYERIKKKKKNEQGGDWFFSRRYPDKLVFVRKLFRQFSEIPAIIKIDTSRLAAKDVFKIASTKVKQYNI